MTDNFVPFENSMKLDLSELNGTEQILKADWFVPQKEVNNKKENSIVPSMESCRTPFDTGGGQEGNGKMYCDLADN